MRQVIIGILKHSITNMNTGSISINVSVNNNSLSKVMPFDYIDHNTKYNILFKIKDNGDGLERDIISYLKNIFRNNLKLFYQLN